MTDAEITALRWLNGHNGDGAFAVGGKGKALIAGGEIAPITRTTWNSLQAQQFVEFYGGESGRARCRITEAGQQAAGNMMIFASEEEEIFDEEDEEQEEEENPYCRMCDGSGDCNECDGTGMVGTNYEDEPCEECDGTGVCTSCMGDGLD